ncbi:hypothetical protein MNBD_ALPHA12-166, partial [hydrothermal vent metagenome]
MLIAGAPAGRWTSSGSLFAIYMPRAPYHNQHDGLKPPYVDCWRSGGALGCQRL